MLDRAVKLKAFLVGVDREACAMYKKELDKHQPPEWSAPVYIAVHNDPEKLPLVAKKQLSERDEKTARQNFTKPGQNPQILIVTDKLLTGYDAPVLYCMSLDKPMRDPVLLQAIARVNRPFEEQNADGGERRKPCGLVVDFVGILGKLKRALAFDSKDVSGVVDNLNVLFADFVRRMTGPAKDYLALATGKMDNKAVEKAIDAFEDKTKREAFYKFFKELEQLYEILALALTEPFRRFPHLPMKCANSRPNSTNSCSPKFRARRWSKSPTASSKSAPDDVRLIQTPLQPT